MKNNEKIIILQIIQITIKIITKITHKKTTTMSQE